jgi:hypothetical protein
VRRIPPPSRGVTCCVERGGLHALASELARLAAPPTLRKLDIAVAYLVQPACPVNAPTHEGAGPSPLTHRLWTRYGEWRSLHIVIVTCACLSTASLSICAWGSRLFVVARVKHLPVESRARSRATRGLCSDSRWSRLRHVLIMLVISSNTTVSQSSTSGNMPAFPSRGGPQRPLKEGSGTVCGSDLGHISLRTGPQGFLSLSERRA